jgi:predicted small integral membrane protein
MTRTNSLMSIRLCKTALVASLALFFTMVAFGNVTDYGSNWQFVSHVLAMDTIFPDSTLRWRAITDERLQTLGYLAIIATEIVTALVLWFGTICMLASLRTTSFVDACTVAVVGLTLGFLLYAVGFVMIGGEWFAMWQSTTWNGETKAFQFLAWIVGVLIVVLMPENARN